MDVAELWVKVIKLGPPVVGAVEPIIASTIRSVRLGLVPDKGEQEACEWWTRL